jgi:hypothetical protein
MLRHILQIFIIAMIAIAPQVFIEAYVFDDQYAAEIKSIIAEDVEKELREYRLSQFAETHEKLTSLCVSLGFNCFPALQLNRCGLRTLAFPFDWNITPLYSLREVLQSHFLDFLNPSYLVRKNEIPGIFNTKYKIALAHDFPEPISLNWLDSLPGISEKYQRRIERFYYVCDLAETVYFFRLKSVYWIFDNHPEDIAAVSKLRDLLMQIFPSQNWVLVAIGNSPEYKNDWGMRQVKNFYIKDDKNEEWDNVFRKLKLIS